MVRHCKFDGIFWLCVAVVSVLSAPRTNGLNNNFIKMFPKLGENVTLKCGGNIMKNSTALWRINHKELSDRAKVMENGDLIISSFSALDAGIYICDLTAADGFIKHSVEYKLKLKHVPESLLDVKVIPYSVLMLITWKDIKDNGGSPITNITIQYREIDSTISSRNWTILQVNPYKVQKEIYSLHPNTLYEVQIWACNEIGDGVKTELTIKTKTDTTEIDLEKRLLEGINTFDTRAWTFAVIVIMSTFSIFGMALCCLFVKDPRIQKSLEDSDDIERIELIPNITLNPGYCET